MVWNSFLIFPCIGNNHPNWLSYFFRGVETTSQYINSHKLTLRALPRGVAGDGVFPLLLHRFSLLRCRLEGWAQVEPPCWDMFFCWTSGAPKSVLLAQKKKHLWIKFLIYHWLVMSSYHRIISYHVIKYLYNLISYHLISYHVDHIISWFANIPMIPPLKKGSHYRSPFSRGEAMSWVVLCFSAILPCAVCEIGGGDYTRYIYIYTSQL